MRSRTSTLSDVWFALIFSTVLLLGLIAQDSATSSRIAAASEALVGKEAPPVSLELVGGGGKRFELDAFKF